MNMGKITWIVLSLTLVAWEAFSAGTNQSNPVFTNDNLKKYGTQTETYDNKSNSREDAVPPAEGRQQEQRGHLDDSHKKQVEETLSRIWNLVANRLLANDIEGALVYFNDGVKDRFRNQYKQMGKDKIASLMAGAKDGVEIESLYDDRIANCGIVRKEGAEEYSYPIRFIKDMDGSWKINGM
jgi:transcriptional regulator with PAS, ATPase and Fis domain